ncbi:MAG: hypothetical protein JRI55_10710 [Deltaproteobacteria bacterium]|nr:hypothetical protein [Deltaproteobacteria bacterium]
MSKTALEDGTKAEGGAREKRAPSLARAAWHGHRGEWFGCFNELKALKRGSEVGDLPDLFLSYYGQAVARCERDLQEAERLCREGLQVAFYRPEAHWNLASVLICARDYESARSVIAQGLAMDGDNRLLRRLRDELQAKAGSSGGTRGGEGLLGRLLDWFSS